MNALRILGIDTSGKVASAAIFDTEANVLLGERSLYTKRGHSTVILPMVESLLADCGLTTEDVDCYAVAVGPGSYTGIRIGIAAVQGLAMVHNTPCIGVSTLDGFAAQHSHTRTIVSLIHAREDLFYRAIYFNNTRIKPDELKTMEEIGAELHPIRNNWTRYPVLMTGEGAEEFERQFEADGNYMFHFISSPIAKLQRGAAICYAAHQQILSRQALENERAIAEEREPQTLPLPTAGDLTPEYLQPVNITRGKPQNETPDPAEEERRLKRKYAYLDSITDWQTWQERAPRNLPTLEELVILGATIPKPEELEERRKAGEALIREGEERWKREQAERERKKAEFDAELERIAAEHGNLDRLHPPKPEGIVQKNRLIEEYRADYERSRGIRREDEPEEPEETVSEIGLRSGWKERALAEYKAIFGDEPDDEPDDTESGGITMQTFRKDD